MRALAIISAMSSCTPAMANQLVEAHVGATSSLAAMQACLRVEYEVGEGL